MAKCPLRTLLDAVEFQLLAQAVDRAEALRERDDGDALWGGCVCERGITEESRSRFSVNAHII